MFGPIMFFGYPAHTTHTHKQFDCRINVATDAIENILMHCTQMERNVFIQRYTGLSVYTYCAATSRIILLESIRNGHGHQKHIHRCPIQSRSHSMLNEESVGGGCRCYLSMSPNKFRA